MKLTPKKLEASTLKVRLTLKEIILGTVPKNKAIYAQYIAGKAAISDDKKKEEVETVEETEAKGWTGFHQDKTGIFLYDYVIRGFLKAAGYALSQQKEMKITAYKTKIDNLVIPRPRRIYFRDAKGQIMKSPDGVVERPLRAMTAQGPRVTLARSDCLNAGCYIEFEILLLKNKDITPQIIANWMGFGECSGLGQFRSGGYGRFDVDVELAEDKSKKKVPVAA